MASKDVFKIEVLNWEKHNGHGPKRGKVAFTHFMLSTRFFDDAKIATLTDLNKLLFICILCRCANDRSSTIELTANQLRSMVDQPKIAMVSRIAALEKNQLIRVLEWPSLIREENRIEEKGIEFPKDSEKRKPRKPRASPAPASAVADTDAKPAGVFIAGYCDRWKARHGSSPPITGKDAGIAKRVANGMSPERIAFYLDAYFAMPDAFVIKAKHPIEFFEMKLKEIAAFAESGAFVTRKQAAQADDMASNMLLLEQVRKGQL